MKFTYLQKGSIIVFSFLVFFLSFSLVMALDVSDNSNTDGVIGVNMQIPTPPINYSTIDQVNSSDFWDNLDTPADISLNDLGDLQFTNNNFNGSGWFNTTGNISADTYFGDWNGGNVNNNINLDGELRFSYSTQPYLFIKPFVDGVAKIETSSGSDRILQFTNYNIGNKLNLNLTDGDLTTTGNISADWGNFSNVNIANNLFVKGAGDFGDNVLISKSSDGGDVAMYLRNTAGTGSTDETSTIEFQTTSVPYGVAKIEGYRMANYNVNWDRLGGLKFYNYDSGSYTLALSTEYGRLVSETPFYIKETPSATSDKAGYGQVWVKSDTPNVLSFTNDVGTDFVIGGHQDNDKLYFGDGLDASIYYDGTNMIINPKEAGTGDVTIIGENDGADTGLFLRNTAGSGSTDETTTFGFGTTNSVFSAKIISGRIGDYGNPSVETGFLDFYTNDGSSKKALRIDEGQNTHIYGDLNVTGTSYLGDMTFDGNVAMTGGNLTAYNGTFSNDLFANDLEVTQQAYFPGGIKVIGQIDLNNALNMNSNNYDIILYDNGATALEMGVNGETQHLTFVTTNNAEKLVLGYNLDGSGVNATFYNGTFSNDLSVGGDLAVTGSLINPKVDNKLMIGLGAVDTASISTVFGDDLIFTDETGSANVQWNAFGEMHFGGASLSNVGNIDTTIIDATEIYNSVANFDIMPDAQYNVDVFADGEPHYLISNSADGKSFKVHRNAVSETDSAVQIYNDKWSRPAIYGYGSDFIFYIPDDDILIYSSNGDIDLQGGSSGDVTIFEFAGSGENPSVRQGGYITNGANEVEVSWTVKDTDDYFHLDRENSNILGLKIDMPVALPNDNSKLYFGGALDSSIYYDGTNLVINPANLGSQGVAIGVEGSPNAFLEAKGPGAIAGGYAERAISGSGTIKSSGFGSIALGYAAGFFNDAYLQASNRGSIAMGWAYMNNITSSGTGSVAMGDASNGPIIASASSAFALGTNVEATATRAMVLGSGVNNNIANTLMIGFNDEDLRVQDDNITIYGNLTIQGNLEVTGCIIYNGGSLGSCV